MKVRAMRTITQRFVGRIRFRRTLFSSFVCLLLVAVYLPTCTAETIGLPEAPVPAQSAPALPQQQTAQNSDQTAGQNQTDTAQQTGSGGGQQSVQSSAHGVAAAPYIRPESVMGSQPAGAAIAPAKQKRRRMFALRIGLIVGAAIAVGTVVALSKSSPARA